MKTVNKKIEGCRGLQVLPKQKKNQSDNGSTAARDMRAAVGAQRTDRKRRELHAHAAGMQDRLRSR